MATKDYIKFRNSVKKDTNLSLEEAYMLETLFDYYNSDLGYAYPSYEVLMKDLKTKRRAKISKLLKALVAKGYIEIGKKYKNNIYNIKKYLFITNKENTNNNDGLPKDSNGENPIEGQIHIDENITVITNETGFNNKQAKDLIKIAGDNLSKILDAFRYVSSRDNVKNIFQYTKWIIKNNVKDIKCEKKQLKFVEGCQARDYSENDHKNIEWQLLGWS